MKIRPFIFMCFLLLVIFSPAYGNDVISISGVAGDFVSLSPSGEYFFFGTNECLVLDQEQRTFRIEVFPENSYLFAGDGENFAGWYGDNVLTGGFFTVSKDFYVLHEPDMGEDSDYLFNKVLTTEGDVFYSGNRANKNRSDGLLFLFSDTGEKKTFLFKYTNEARNVIFTNIALLKNKDLLLAGRITAPTNGEKDFFATRVTRDGKIIWAKRYVDIDPDILNDVVITEKGIFLVGFGRMFQDTAEEKTQIRILRIDEHGNMLDGYDFFLDSGIETTRILQNGNRLRCVGSVISEIEEEKTHIERLKKLIILDFDEEGLFLSGTEIRSNKSMCGLDAARNLIVIGDEENTLHIWVKPLDTDSLPYGWTTRSRILEQKKLYGNMQDIPLEVYEKFPLIIPIP